MLHTDHVTVTLKGAGRKAKVFSVPRAVGKKLEKIIADNLATYEKAASVPADVVFPVLRDDALRPATMLRGARYKAEMTQKELAAQLGIHQHHLSEMENGKRAISRKMAKRLADILGCDSRLFA